MWPTRSLALLWRLGHVGGLIIEEEVAEEPILQDVDSSDDTSDDNSSLPGSRKRKRRPRAAHSAKRSKTASHCMQIFERDSTPVYNTDGTGPHAPILRDRCTHQATVKVAEEDANASLSKPLPRWHEADGVLFGRSI